MAAATEVVVVVVVVLWVWWFAAETHAKADLCGAIRNWFAAAVRQRHIDASCPRATSDGQLGLGYIGQNLERLVPPQDP